jgi:hypothetical protein
LGEHHVRNVGVVGSIPIISTIYPDTSCCPAARLESGPTQWEIPNSVRTGR